MTTDLKSKLASSVEAAAKKAAEEAEAARKRQAEEVSRARKAGVGPRTGAPIGMAQAARPRGQSVGETLRSAIKNSGASI